jgi:hypothetical protein
MPVLNRIAYFRNRRDEVPNQELARELVETRDTEGIREIAENLGHVNQNVQSDCLKVLYEIGYLAPDLIAGYVDRFLALLRHKNNRMVWGGMIALATIAELRPKEIWNDVDTVIEVVDRGTLITVVWGVKTLARVAAADDAYRQRLFPTLMKCLRECLPRDVPMHAESILRAVDASNKAEFLSVIESRKAEMTASQLARLKKVSRQAEARYG